jgi:hypothetical protein
MPPHRKIATFYIKLSVHKSEPLRYACLYERLYVSIQYLKLFEMLVFED